MASGDAERRITLRAIYDNTNLKTGTQESERYMDSLARAVDDSSDDMRRSLQSIDDGVSSTLGSGGSFSRSVDDVEREGGRLKDIGGEVGSEFAENIGEGIRSGDIAGTVLETFTSLGPALGVLGIGAAIGAGIVNGMIKGAQQSRQAFLDSVNNIFSQVEGRAAESNRKIRKSILDTFTFQTVLEQLGGTGGVAAGVERVQKLVQQTGVSFNDIVDIIRGNITPANRDVLTLLQQQAQQTVNIAAGGKGIATMKSQEARAAQEILGLYDKTLDSQVAAENALQKQRDYLDHQKQVMHDIASDAERTANAAERTAAAVAKWAGRRLPDPTGTT